MATIYEAAIEKVRSGARFSVDLKRHSLRINGRYVILNGKHEGDLGVGPTTCREAMGILERKFDRYYHSIPSERSDNARKLYWKALPESELPDEDMMYGHPSEVCRLDLELSLLCYILNGSIRWEELSGANWFWVSKTNRKFAILREWVENGNENDNQDK